VRPASSDGETARLSGQMSIAAMYETNAGFAREPPQRRPLQGGWTGTVLRPHENRQMSEIAAAPLQNQQLFTRSHVPASCRQTGFAVRET
jgi:hypothetical protein